MVHAAGSDRELLGTIQATPWLTELLAFFDFDVSKRADGPFEPVSLSDGSVLDMIAGDAGGGAYFLVGAGSVRPVVYAGSEGEGGLIAHSLRDALALLIGLPSLHDATTSSLDEDGGRHLRDWIARADQIIRADRPTLDQDRERVRAALDLPAGDLLPSLHAAAADERYRPINAQGDRYRSMVGPDDFVDAALI
ncbi:hypothetical protein [Cryptosporangium japonicum]|uniref:SUKH-4 immunity protein of toxin-antitoxin system n=1 Tax=Cryptosporangium japonicum TaxID=80872 RepID=A0ABN0UE06_9ACTN